MMNILKEILKNEVFPALGCTEPIAVAYAASVAAHEIDGDLERVVITVDPGVYKNGMAVTVPNTNGQRGNLIAGVLGALVKKPELKMEILQGVQKKMIRRAAEMIKAGKATILYDPTRTGLHIDVRIKTREDSARAVIENGHTNIVRVEKNERTLFDAKSKGRSKTGPAYKKILKKLRINDLVDLAAGMDQSDYRYIKRGIEMNLRIAVEGRKLKKVGYYLGDLAKKGYLQDDVFTASKTLVASASDARMAGVSLPVMSSGGSGNQGIVAILVPYTVGIHFKVPEKKILRSIALSHLLNSYIKCFTGDLSPLCGCSIAAGVGAAVAIVYQQKGNHTGKIAFAVNNLISDLGGMLCDGAKAGCALKVVSSADSAIRSAYMALNNHGITEAEGFVGKTAEETIRNLSKISAIGMAKVDDTMLAIMKKKRP
ncbi:MAG: L-serine ammonia-lyase, iron-sulfur-dependent, subunit alpha [Desulfobacterales bacterium]